MLADEFSFGNKFAGLETVPKRTTGAMYQSEVLGIKFEFQQMHKPASSHWRGVLPLSHAPYQVAVYFDSEYDEFPKLRPGARETILRLTEIENTSLAVPLIQRALGDHCGGTTTHRELLLTSIRMPHDPLVNLRYQLDFFLSHDKSGLTFAVAYEGIRAVSAQIQILEPTFNSLFGAP